MNNGIILRSLVREADRQVETVSNLIRRKRRLLLRGQNGPGAGEADQRHLSTLLSIKAAHESHRNHLKSRLDQHDAALARELLHSAQSPIEV